MRSELIVNYAFEKIAMSGASAGFHSGNFAHEQAQQVHNQAHSHAQQMHNQARSNVVLQSQIPNQQAQQTQAQQTQAQQTPQKADDDATNKYNNVAGGIRAVAGKQWYQDLPESLRDIVDSELESKAWGLADEGMGAKSIAMVLESDIKSSLDDAIIGKYKYIDDMNNKIISSQIYSDTYSNSNGRNKGLAIGTGIGAALGGGLGLASGGRAAGALIGGGLGAGAGALIGRVAGHASDTNKAFSASQKEVAPDYEDIVDSAYKQYKSRR